MTPLAPDAWLAHSGSGRRYPLADGQSWAIGRGDGCPVRLGSRSVSRLHALIQRREGGDFQLVDLGSRNGSFRNGRRVSLPAPLRDQDRLVFGDQELRFRNPDQSSTAREASMADSRNAPTTALHTNQLATILVVDIRDFTPMARSVSESTLSQTIGTWFLRSGSIAQRLGSWAQKYIGDAMMAVWVHDDCERVRDQVLAVLQAAAEIDAASAEISRALALERPIRIGAGVNTGSTILGGADYTALGDAVNAAFRLEAETKAMGVGVLVGEPSFRELKLQTPSAFERREVQLKGYETLSTAWSISFEGLRQFVAAGFDSAANARE
jgi:adenylate cyclase